MDVHSFNGGGASASPHYRPWARDTAPRWLTLDDALCALPSLPRAVLNRLVANLIEHLDEQGGDPDLEPDDPPEDGGDGEAWGWPMQWEPTP